MSAVSPYPRGELDHRDENRLRLALATKEQADKELREAVLDAASNGASVRAIAGFTGLSTNTVSRWKRGE